MLINKLYGPCFSGKELEWFRSYLHDRKISTVVDHVHSSVKVVTSGVPQGFVLGRLFLVSFFRELPSVISATCKMFADDTLVYDTACCPEKASSCCRLSFDLSAAAGWTDDWSTVFNAAKSNQLLISRTGQLSGRTLNKLP